MRRASHLDRDQRHILSHPEAGELPQVGERGARRIRVLGEGAALHDPSPRAREARRLVKRFLKSGVTELGDRLGPLLWQFAADQEVR